MMNRGLEIDLFIEKGGYFSNVPQKSLGSIKPLLFTSSNMTETAAISQRSNVCPWHLKLFSPDVNTCSSFLIWHFCIRNALTLHLISVLMQTALKRCSGRNGLKFTLAILLKLLSLSVLEHSCSRILALPCWHAACTHNKLSQTLCLHRSPLRLDRPLTNWRSKVCYGSILLKTMLKIQLCVFESKDSFSWISGMASHIFHLLFSHLGFEVVWLGFFSKKQQQNAWWNKSLLLKSYLVLR